MDKLENEFKKNLKKELKTKYPECLVTQLDPNDIQGIPDLLVLYKNKWAVLECKKNKDASHRPNQDYYVEKLDDMSFSRFIYPENKEEVLKDLDKIFNM